MTKRTNVGLEKSSELTNRLSVFDRIVKEIDTDEIPSKYIEYILVQYLDGRVVELRGNDIMFPVPLNKDMQWDKINNSSSKLKDVKVFIRTDILEQDINELVEIILGRYC